MFGIGVIASSAWMHLLPEAYETFTNPCINLNGPVSGTFLMGLLGMMAGFGAQVIELFAMGHSRKDRPCQDQESLLGSLHDSRPGRALFDEEVGLVGRHFDATTIDTPYINMHRDNTVTGSFETDSRLSMESDTPSNSDIQLRDLNPKSPSTPTAVHISHIEISRASSSFQPPSSHQNPTSTTTTTTQHISIIILESGILFHSVIIGLTLGVTPDTEFRVLLLAVGFHQLFEGMALGVMISNLDLKFTTKFFVLGLLYPLTTPLGIVVGILVREKYNGNSQSLLLLQGVLNSLSAGILMYNVYAELMGVEINHNEVFTKFSKGFKFACFMAMYVGAIALAILALWA
jgi:zinc transporter 1/2/3